VLARLVVSGCGVARLGKVKDVDARHAREWSVKI
jgi:hypothetical protein